MELVYGTSLRLPGEFFIPHNASGDDPSSYVQQLKGTTQILRCTPTRKPNHTSSHIDDSLHSSSHVFVQQDAIKKPLQTPYDGPFKVLDRSPKYFTLDLNGCKDTVGVDRLKLAYLDSSTASNLTNHYCPNLPPL